MGVVMKEFLDRFANMEKIANETLAADPKALVGVDSIHGSEHDAKVPADAKKPDPEVQQGLPAGATTAEGAVNGGDAKPLNEDKLEVDQPLVNPEKKPLITDDALTAKEASDHLEKLVGDLLSDIKAEKKAQCASAPKAATTETKKDDTKKEEKCDEGKCNDGEKKASTKKDEITLNDDMIAKIAEAAVAFMDGRKAAEGAIKEANDKKSGALALIKSACIKAAQEAGLDPATAALAADNAMAAAGIDAGAATADAGAAQAAAADATLAADAGAADAANAAGAADAAGAAAAEDVQIPDDVTEEELGAAIVDLVQTGQLDADTAKALVDEIAGGDNTSAGITEDQAAEIIANGLESGEITPDQAKELVAAIENGGAPAKPSDAESSGAADAENAVKEASDEAAGAAACEEAIKMAAAQIRENAIKKVASAIVENRNKNAEASKSPLLNKVASILKKRKEVIDNKISAQEKEASANKKNDKSEEEKYLAGFCKKAAEMGVDPKALARYIVARSNEAK